MSLVKTTNVIAGQVMDSTNLTNVLSDIGNATSSLDPSNTKSEMISQFHVNYLSPPFNDRFNYIEDYLNTYTIASTTYTLLNFGGTVPFYFNFAPDIFLAPGQTLRAHFDVWVNEVEFTGQGWNVIGSELDDCYQFSMFATVDGVPNTQVSCEATYSTSEARDFQSPPKPNPSFVAITERRRIRQKCNLTMTYMNTTNVDIRFGDLEVRGRLGNLTYLTGVTLRYGTFTVLRVRN